MKIGLFFGSFNPVHVGHLLIANYFVEFTDIDQLWFVISPKNPLKDSNMLIHENYRLEMLQIALTEANSKYKICDIELKMPIPSYTIKTLEELQKNYKDFQFIIITGLDNFLTLPQWYESSKLIEKYEFYVYPRKGYEKNINFEANYKIVDAPIVEISSTLIRNSIRENRDVRYFLPSGVYEYILKTGIYKHDSPKGKE